MTVARRRARSTRRCGRCCARGRLAVRVAGSTSTGTPGERADRSCRCSAAPLEEVPRRRRDHPAVEAASARAGRPLLRPRLPGRGPAPRTVCRWPSCSTRSTTAWPPGESPRASLNYRRFFDVDLAHRRSGSRTPRSSTPPTARSLDADPCRGRRRPAHRPPRRAGRPAGYLAGSPTATGGAWVVVEKILEGDERLPARLAHAPARRATTRCCASAALFVDPAGPSRSTDLSAELLGERRRTSTRSSRESKRSSCSVDARPPRCSRLVRLVGRALPDRRLRDHARRGGPRGAIARRHGPLPRYVRPGRAGVDCRGASASSSRGGGARERLGRRRPRRRSTWSSTSLSARRPPRGGRRPRAGRLRRPVPADVWPGDGQGRSRTPPSTASIRLVGLNEVGGDPGHFGVTPASSTPSRSGWPQTGRSR